MIVSFFCPYHLVGGAESILVGERILLKDYILGLNVKGVASFLYMMPIEKREWQGFLCRNLTQNTDRAVSYSNEHLLLYRTSCLKSQRTNSCSFTPCLYITRSTILMCQGCSMLSVHLTKFRVYPPYYIILPF